MLKKWIMKKIEEKRERKILDEYDRIFEDFPPLWKYLGFTSLEDMYQNTVQVFWFYPDNAYMATKCEDGWVVWEDFGWGYCRNHIAFSTWKEAVVFLYEESETLDASWDPELFGFREGVDPFSTEPDFEFFREVMDWDDGS